MTGLHPLNNKDEAAPASLHEVPRAVDEWIEATGGIASVTGRSAMLKFASLVEAAAVRGPLLERIAELEARVLADEHAVAFVRAAIIHARGQYEDAARENTSTMRRLESQSAGNKALNDAVTTLDAPIRRALNMDTARSLEARAEAAEARLADAVRALERIDNLLMFLAGDIAPGHDVDSLRKIARDFLAAAAPPSPAGTHEGGE